MKSFDVITPKTQYIYFILDPTTNPFTTKDGIFHFNNTPFYVGKGIRDRYIGKKNILTETKIESLKKSGKDPDYIIIPYLNDKDALENEKYFIQNIGRVNKNTGPLLNQLEGGINQYKKDFYKELNVSIKKQKRTKEFCENQSKRLQGKKHTELHKRRTGAASKNTIFINNGIISTKIKKENLDTFILQGWKLGYIRKSDTSTSTRNIEVKIFSKKFSSYKEATLETGLHRLAIISYLNGNKNFKNKTLNIINNLEKIQKQGNLNG